MDLPPRFRTIVSQTWEAEGEAWLSSLPVLVAEIANQWSLRVQPPFPNLTYNYVAPALLPDGREAVLKLGLPRDELSSEIEALRFYPGRGAVTLLQADPDAGAMLLERLHPGEPLTSLSGDPTDERATEALAEVMCSLHGCGLPEAPFPTVSEWGRAFQDFVNSDAVPPSDPIRTEIEQASSLYWKLCDTSAEPVLLHGDLHHDNVLSSPAGWVAIDPKGVIGEPTYEAGAFLRNLWPERVTIADPGAILSRRIHLLSETAGFDRWRVWAWGYSQAVLSAVWSWEDGDPEWRSHFAMAKLLKPLQP